MVIGHVLPEKNESLLEAYEKFRLAADSKSCCDYALHVGVTWWGPKVLRHSSSAQERALPGRACEPLTHVCAFTSARCVRRWRGW